MRPFLMARGGPTGAPNSHSSSEQTAGIVVARDAGARKLRVGDRAYAYDYASPKGGFYAEYVAVRERNAARVPEVLDLL